MGKLDLGILSARDWLKASWTSGIEKSTIFKPLMTQPLISINHGSIFKKIFKLKDFVMEKTRI